jgi:NOL1/NOP2/fmu family ribosome biogenesis protein
MILEGSLSPSSSRTEKFEAIDSAEVIAAWQSRFDMPGEAFIGFAFYRRAQNIWAFSDVDLPRLSYEAVGMRMMSLKEKPWKPTTCALQVFGRHARKNTVALNSEQARRFMSGESQDLEAEAEAGFVIALFQDQVLGCGLYSRGKLVSQLPKERRISVDTKGDL